MDTNQPPGPALQTFDEWKARFGFHLAAMAAKFGIMPEDVALATASVLLNLAGPTQGVTGVLGRRTATGISLVQAGRPGLRESGLTEFLLTPAFRLQDMLRSEARMIPRATLDQWHFGMAGANPKSTAGLSQGGSLWQRSKQMEAAFIETLKERGFRHGIYEERPVGRDPQMPEDALSADDRAIRERHFPSVMFMNPDATRLHDMLAESLDRTALLVDTDGGLLEAALGGRSLQGGRKTSPQLATLLRGTDQCFPPVYAGQGHGSFERARVNLLSSVDPEQLGDALGGDNAPARGVVDSLLFWNPEPCEMFGVSMTGGDALMKAYRDSVKTVLDVRLWRAVDQTVLGKDDANAMEVAEKRFVLAAEHRCREAGLGFCPGAFCGLLPRLVWAFLQLRGRDEPMWCIEAARIVGGRAVERHLEFLRQARTAAELRSHQRIMTALVAKLERKSPLTIREMQRASNRLKRDKLELCLHHLEGQGRVRCDGQGRYELTAGISTTSNAEEPTLS